MPYRDRLGQCLGAIIILTDVSEQVALRRAAEALLREFTSLADALDQVVWKRDHEMGRILYISNRIQTLTGWSVEELCSDAGVLDDAILAEDQAAVAAARRSGEQGWRVTFRVQIPDGRIRAFEEVATVMDDGIDHEVVGTLMDVTEVRLMEHRNALLAGAFQEIQASETRSIALLDDTLQFVSVSEAFAACVGLPACELNGQSLDCLEAALTLPLATAAQQQDDRTTHRSLRQLAQDVILSHQPAERQTVLMARANQPGDHAQLDLLPLGGGGQALGVLLQLSRLASA
jgi:two-component system CheB/CheR fusion protein